MGKPAEGNFNLPSNFTQKTFLAMEEKARRHNRVTAVFVVEKPTGFKKKQEGSLNSSFLGYSSL